MAIIGIMALMGMPSAQSALFYATGIFSNGASLSGTLTIDTTIGSVTGANLAVSAPSNLQFTQVLGQGFSPAPFFFGVTIRSPTNLFDINLGLEVTSLVGYLGGAICSSSTPNCAPTILFNLSTSSADVVLRSGSLSLTPPTSVPAPGALLLLAFGLLGLGLARPERA
jgi:hypothetical protein